MMLLSNNALLIKKKKKGTFLMHSWYYEIYDPETDKQIGAVKDELEGVWKIFGSMLRKNLVPKNLNIYDCADDSKAFTIKISPLSSKVKVHDREGKLVALFTSKLLGGCFYTVNDPEGIEIGQIKGYVMTKEFSFISPLDTTLGVITKSWDNADGTSGYCSALDFVVAVGDTGVHQPELIKMILVAAALALDLALSKK